MTASRLTVKNIPKIRRWAGLLLMAGTLSACAALPHEGPNSIQIANKENATVNEAGFVLIDVNRDVADYLKGQPRRSFSEKFGKGRAVRAETIGVGDILDVMIWEADEGGLFSSSGVVNRGSIPSVVVDGQGLIQIPYAGTFKASGKTPRQLSNLITSKLAKKTVEPQVHVSKKDNISKTVTVSGAVGQPGIYPLSLRGDDLVDLIAVAGGAKYPGYETTVTLTRRGKKATAYLSHVLSTPSDNIYMSAGDQIYLERKPMTFTAFGAVDKKGVYEFNADHLSVLEAVGRVSGLSDNRADSTGVFLMRFEQAKTAYALSGMSGQGSSTKVLPVIYRLNLQDPSQYFFAKVIELRPEDVIYVANAPSVEVDKFLTIIGKAVGIGLASSALGKRF